MADAPSTDAEADPESGIASMFAAVRRGRMDLALKHARPLATTAGAGEAPARFLARECSERAARSWSEGAEERKRGVELAAGGAAFSIPGRGGVRPSELFEGFWMSDVTVQHSRAEAIMKLLRASLALRGLELRDTAASLQQRLESGDAEAAIETAAVTRDYQVFGEAVVTRALTNQSFAVLQAFLTKKFSEDPTNMQRCPMLFTLLLKIGRHTTDELKGATPSSGSVPELQQWAERRQAAAARLLHVLAEVTSEAATTLFNDPDDGLALLRVAEVFVEADCPRADRQRLLGILRDTATRIHERRAGGS